MAKEIWAIDSNEKVIQIAKSKDYLPSKVNLQIQDLYAIDESQKHESLLGAFIWSHINLHNLTTFIHKIINVVQSGGWIVLIDNKFVPGSSTPIFETDNAGNTYQLRTLENGKNYKVLKNFPDESFIRKIISNEVAQIEFIDLTYYWILILKTL